MCIQQLMLLGRCCKINQCAWSIRKAPNTNSPYPQSQDKPILAWTWPLLSCQKNQRKVVNDLPRMAKKRVEYKTSNASRLSQFCEWLANCLRWFPERDQPTQPPAKFVTQSIDICLSLVTISCLLTWSLSVEVSLYFLFNTRWRVFIIRLAVP